MNRKRVAKLMTHSATAFVAVIAIAIMMASRSNADAPGCSLTDQCSSSEYMWTTYTCFYAGAGSRCWVVDRKWCGTNPSTWMYQQYNTWGVYPCSTAPCAVGARCIGYSPPGDPGS